MTLPITYSWSPLAERLKIAYEAPQGRRVNAIGGYFCAGPSVGEFVFETRASVPKKKSPKREAPHNKKQPKQTKRERVEERAPWPWALAPEEIGPINAEVFIGFVWDKIAARPRCAGVSWRRDVPVVIVLDNYSVHRSDRVKAEMPLWEAAGVHLFFLPSYSPKLSEIEPLWQAIKHKEMQDRSFNELFCLKRAVEEALENKASRLAATHIKTDNSLRKAA
jgi:hypothetical protein